VSEKRRMKREWEMEADRTDRVIHSNLMDPGEPEIVSSRAGEITLRICRWIFDEGRVGAAKMCETNAMINLRRSEATNSRPNR